jgi:hypothetical protein
MACLIVLALGACSQFRVWSRHDPGADFAGLRTYAWLPLDQAEPADQQVLDRYIDARIRGAVDRELGAKGYRAAGSEAPDFLLNYRLASAPGEETRATRGSYFTGVLWGGWPGVEGFYTETYDAGTLYLAVIDGQPRHMIWVGAASARLLPHISLEKAAKRVDDAVHEILAPFPPR